MRVDDGELLRNLRDLETALHQPEVRRDPARLEELLHESFTEIGQSGRTYDRDEILKFLLLEAVPWKVWAQDFRVAELADGVALLTYKSARLNATGELYRHTVRSSLWQRTAEGWKLRFHQGTPTSVFAKDATSTEARIDVLASLPVRRGHFLLESGYHSDLWLTLDELFVEPSRIAPLVVALAERLRAYAPKGVCGPLMGGAFLAQAVAKEIGIRFYHAELLSVESPGDALFHAEYRLPPGLVRRVEGETMVVVDDAISAGSSVRATVAALDAAGATTVALGTFLLLGDAAREHFAKRELAVEALEERAFELWRPEDCPLCESGSPLEDPREGV